MRMDEQRQYIELVLSRVRFRFDHAKIRDELQAHLEDATEWYCNGGMAPDAANRAAIASMGDAQEVGRALDRVHHPLIGWLWRVSNWLVRILAVCCIVTLLTGMGSLFSRPISRRDRNAMERIIPVDRTVEMDERVLTFDELLCDDTGKFYLTYHHYSKRWLGSGWSLGTVGEISDGEGNALSAISRGENGGWICYGVVSGDLPQSDTLVLTYDRFGRYYQIVIPLEGGGTQ
ncbi:MAG: hypothetical protein E7409_01710 [Ruminococcaceae bacterium]|nr:hypothetical protein [Oscillospiraceae bacterium]